MGLDQYLKIRRCIGGSSYDDENSQKTFNEIKKAVNIYPDKNCEYITIEYNVIYWRKANQIHAWFVKNVQDGKDECQTSHVTREQLQSLLDDCIAVLTGKKYADDTLPTQSGFFFGSTEYDEYYKQDLQYTVDKLSEVLNNKDLQGAFYYEASW